MSWKMSIGESKKGFLRFFFFSVLAKIDVNKRNS